MYLYTQGKKVEVKVDKKGDDRKLNLTFRMMLGVRVAVGRQASPFLKDGLLADDFTQARIMCVCDVSDACVTICGEVVGAGRLAEAEL